MEEHVYRHYHDEKMEDEKKKTIDNMQLDDSHKEYNKIRMLRDNEETREKYNVFKEFKIEGSKIKNYLYNKYNATLGDSTEILIGVVCKIYLTELIEVARSHMSWDEDYIRPEHLEMAFLHLFYDENKLSFSEIDMSKCFEDQ